MAPLVHAWMEQRETCWVVTKTRIALPGMEARASRDTLSRCMMRLTYSDGRTVCYLRHFCALDGPCSLVPLTRIELFFVLVDRYRS